MCNHPEREAAMVVTHRNDHGVPIVWCDPCLEPLIRALNDGGLPTAASCCGHDGHGSDGEQTNAPGWVILRGGRHMLIHERRPDAGGCPQ